MFIKVSICLHMYRSQFVCVCEHGSLAPGTPWDMYSNMARTEWFKYSTWRFMTPTTEQISAPHTKFQDCWTKFNFPVIQSTACSGNNKQNLSLFLGVSNRPIQRYHWSWTFETSEFWYVLKSETSKPIHTYANIIFPKLSHVRLTLKPSFDPPPPTAARAAWSATLLRL